MNAVIDLSRRLLKLFPVSFIKESFVTESGLQDEIITYIINHNTAPVIRKFALDNINHTKQHIYLFTLNHIFNRNTFVTANFPIPIIESSSANGIYRIYGHPIVGFRATVSDPLAVIDLNFHQPIKITAHGRHLIIQVTILEKNMSNYFPNRRVFEAKKIIAEEVMVESIRAFFALQYNVSVCDINSGVKALWQTDVIDSKYARYRKARSISTEAMDENHTIKVEYPPVYNEMINSPLEKMVFRYLRDDDLWCEHFTVDPSRGTLSMALFPENPNQIDNVINEILSNN